MRIVINGQSTEVPPSCRCVDDLLTLLNPGYPVLVELNGLALFPREFPGTFLKEGDSLELMRMVAGG